MVSLPGDLGSIPTASSGCLFDSRSFLSLLRYRITYEDFLLHVSLRFLLPSLGYWLGYDIPDGIKEQACSAPGTRRYSITHLHGAISELALLFPRLPPNFSVGSSLSTMLSCLVNRIARQPWIREARALRIAEITTQLGLILTIRYN